MRALSAIETDDVPHATGVSAAPHSPQSHLTAGVLSLAAGATLPADAQRQDQILFVHSGRAQATVGDSTFAVGRGAFVHVPPHVSVTLRNMDEHQDCRVAFVSTKPL